MCTAAGQVRRRGDTAELLIEDVGSGYQGEYSCVARNSIGGEGIEVQSDSITIEVTGVPEVVKEVTEVVGVIGQDVRIEGQFCSDPPPLWNTWEWDGVVLPAGSQMGGHFKAEQVAHPSRDDCYISRLVIRRLEMKDARNYVTSVENREGKVTVTTLLRITDPVSMASVIAVVLTILIIFVLMVSILLISYRKEKLCLKVNSMKKKLLFQKIFTPMKHTNYLI